MLYVNLRQLLSGAAVSLTMVASVTWWSASAATEQPAALPKDPSTAAVSFFQGKVPPRVEIPPELQGKPGDRYEVRKLSGKWRGRPVKIFYTVNKTGRIGEMYVEGFGLGGSGGGTGNTGGGGPSVNMTRSTFLEKAIACGSSLNCYFALVDKAMDECKRLRDAANCWMCKQVTGDSRDEDCSFL
jgi:hypothetical protein